MPLQWRSRGTGDRLHCNDYFQVRGCEAEPACSLIVGQWWSQLEVEKRESSVMIRTAQRNVCPPENVSRAQFRLPLQAYP